MKKINSIVFSLIAISTAFVSGNLRVEAAEPACSSDTEKTTVSPLNELPFHRGVNINAWFDRKASKVDPDKIKDSDLDNLRRLGMDVIRIPINFHSNVGPAPDFKLDEEYLKNLDNTIERITSRGFWVIVDHHSLSVEKFMSYGEELITSCCCQLANRYKNKDKIVLELFNEPFGDYLKENWPTMQGRIVKAVRACDPDLMIVVTGWGGDPRNLQDIPEYEDPRVVYTFHYYDPLMFTHQQAYWNKGLKPLSGYPFPYDKDRMPAIHPEWENDEYLVDLYNRYTVMASAEQIHKDIAAVADWAAKHGKLIFCGEFGALNTSEPSDRYSWYKAVADALTDKNIPWTLWQYNDELPVNFSIFKDGKNYNTLDTDMMEALRVTVSDDL